MFNHKTISSFESIFLRISGMRMTEEYEIVKLGEESEISEYEMRCSADNGWERQLRRKTVVQTEEILELLNRYAIMKWDGFNGKHPRGVCDGEMFSFRAAVNDGEKIRAEGSANFPKGFMEFRNAIGQILRLEQEKQALLTGNRQD